MFMTAATLKAFVRTLCDETISSAKSGGVDPDPVVQPILKILAPDQASISAPKGDTIRILGR
jgi:hypothetical protein